MALAKPSTIGWHAPLRRGCDRGATMTASPALTPRTLISPDVISRLAQIVGSKNALTDPGEQESYLVEERGLYRGHTRLVLRRCSVDEVAAILRFAIEPATPILP